MTRLQTEIDFRSKESRHDCDPATMVFNLSMFFKKLGRIMSDDEC